MFCDLFDFLRTYKFRTLLVLLILFVASRFVVPYSLNGPAMSCLSRGPRAAFAYTEKNGFDLKKTLIYVENSGFEFRNLSLYDDEVVLVYTHQHQFTCFPLNIVLMIDGSIMRIHVRENQHTRESEVFAID